MTIKRSYYTFNPFPHTACLHQMTLKTCSQTYAKYLSMEVYLLNRVENIVAKGETIFSKSSLLQQRLKPSICGKGLMTISHHAYYMTRSHHAYFMTISHHAYIMTKVIMHIL